MALKDQFNLPVCCIIAMVVLFVIVFNRADSAYNKTIDTQKQVCEANNDRLSVSIRGLIVLSRAAENRSESWEEISDALSDPSPKIKSAADVQIGTNAVESQTMRELADYMGDSAGENSLAPHSKDPQKRSQSKC